MSFSAQTVEALRAARCWARERDEARGYSINYKRIALAFLAEFVVIGTSLYGALMFSQMYGSGNDTARHMMMLAPISYALIEFCRVPLALSTRTQRSLVIKALAAIGVAAAMGVTVKSMSQLGEIMFRPRLFEVVKQHELLIGAQNEHASLVKRIEDADAVVEQLSQELTYAEQHLSEATTAVAGLPPPNCQKLWVTTRQNRRVQTTKCTVDTRTEAMKKNLEQASTTRDAVKGRLGSAQKDRATLKRDEVDRKLSEAQVAHKDAVFHSQLHSFTAMAFAKDPTQVTDGEIAWFLRIFVFAPAVFVSLASTFLAITAVEKIKPKKPEPSLVEIDEGAGAYILEPFAQQIIREATEAAEQAAANAIGKATRHESRPELKIVGES
jgi:hypothetical protein